MKVLLIDVNCKNSSTGNIVYNLYNYINSSGDEAAICYGRGTKIQGKNIFKFGIDAETYLHALLTRITGFTGCFSFFSTRRLIKYIKIFAPDVVHIHELHAYFVNVKTLINFLKTNHIRTVMTLHCEFAYTGKCGHSVECEQWKTECKKCPHLKQYVSTMWFDHTNFMFKQKKKAFNNFYELSIITPSNWLAERVKDSFLKNYPLSVIHNGIDITIFHPKDVSNLRRELRINKNEKIVLSLAPHLMTKIKGGIFVKKIARILNNKKIRFVMVGVDGVDRVYENNVIMCGPLSDKNLLADYYSLADLFLICSERENFPTTCIEAQCCGTPVYGFNTGGISETCVNREGHFVDYNNCNKLAQLISEAPYKTADTADRLSRKAFLEYSFSSFSEKNIEIYRLK